MSETTARRDFLKVSALAGIALPHVHAAENNTIQLALVGCGGRGTGAVENAFHIQNGPVKLVAMADVFPQKLSDSHGSLRGRFASQMDVPQERQFIGFDGYRHAIDALKPGDVATPGHAASVPQGALPLRHRQGVELLHGEAGHGRRANDAADDCIGPGGGTQEPEGRHGSDGALLPRAAGTAEPRPWRADRRHRRDARLSHGVRRRRPSPLRASRDGKYAVPEPGIKKTRES